MENLAARVTALETAFGDANAKLDEMLNFLGPNSLLRRHGMRALAAVVGAAIYAGFIDGKMGAFLSHLIGTV